MRRCRSRISAGGLKEIEDKEAKLFDKLVDMPLNNAKSEQHPHADDDRF